MRKFLKLKHSENSENCKRTRLVKCGFTSKPKTLLLSTAIPPTLFIPTIYHMSFIRLWYSLDCNHVVSFAIVSNWDFHFFFFMGKNNKPTNNKLHWYMNWLIPVFTSDGSPQCGGHVVFCVSSARPFLSSLHDETIKHYKSPKAKTAVTFILN